MLERDVPTVSGLLQLIFDLCWNVMFLLSLVCYSNIRLVLKRDVPTAPDLLQ